MPKKRKPAIRPIAISPADVKLIQTRTFAIHEIVRVFEVPAPLLGNRRSAK